MGLPNKCFQGHVYFGKDCPYCVKERKDAELLYSIVNEEE